MGDILLTFVVAIGLLLLFFVWVIGFTIHKAAPEDPLKRRMRESLCSEAVASALLSHAASREVNALCPACNSAIRLEHMQDNTESAQNLVEAKCSCGGCKGTYRLAFNAL